MLDELGLDPAKPIAVIRTPPAVSLYHRFENDVLGGVLERLEGTQAVVLPRTPQQRAELAGRAFIVPERAIDAQSLIAYADLVVSAGGTMNREAVALGTPVWTTFQGRLGAVDEQLIADGRLQILERADDVVLEKRAPARLPTASVAIPRSSRRCSRAGCVIQSRSHRVERRSRMRAMPTPWPLAELTADDQATLAGVARRVTFEGGQALDRRRRASRTRCFSSSRARRGSRFAAARSRASGPASLVGEMSFASGDPAMATRRRRRSADASRA